MVRIRKEEPKTLGWILHLETKTLLHVRTENHSISESIKRDTWPRLQRSPWPVLQQRDLGRSALERLNKNQGECELMGQQWQRRREHSEERLGGRTVLSLLWSWGWETGKFCGCLKFWLVDNGIIAWGKMVQGLSFIRLIISVFNILTINKLAVSALSCSIAN